GGVFLAERRLRELHAVAARQLDADRELVVEVPTVLAFDHDREATERVGGVARGVGAGFEHEALVLGARTGGAGVLAGRRRRSGGRLGGRRRRRRGRFALATARAEREG